MSKKGEIREGDVFGCNKQRYLVVSFEMDSGVRFAEVIVFCKHGVEKKECFVLQRLFDMKFLMNIMDIKLL